MSKEIKTNRGRKPKNTDYNSVFAQRFRDLIKDNNLTLPELAEHLNTTRQSIGQWKNGDTVPNIIMLKTIAEYFNVSADYLIGIESGKTHESTNIREKIKLNDKSIEVLQALPELCAFTPSEILNVLICNEKFKSLLDWLSTMCSTYSITPTTMEWKICEYEALNTFRDIMLGMQRQYKNTVTERINAFNTNDEKETFKSELKKYARNMFVFHYNENGECDFGSFIGVLSNRNKNEEGVTHGND